MLELLKSQMDTGVGIVTAMIGLVVLAVTSVFKIFALYDQHWSRRHHKILKELRAAEPSDGQLNKYLDDALYLEVFRIASGVSTNKLTADYLRELAKVGLWNRHQIKQISKFLVTSPDAPGPIFRITEWQTASARLSLALTVILMGMGLLFGLGIMMKGAGTLAGILAGFGVEIAFIVAAACIGTPYHSYKIARAFETYLTKHPEILAKHGAQTANTLANPVVDQAIVSGLSTAVIQ